MLRERTRNGLDAARKAGRVGGRRPKLKPHQQREIMRLVNSDRKPRRMQPDYLTSIQLPCHASYRVPRYLKQVLRSIGP